MATEAGSSTAYWTTRLYEHCKELIWGVNKKTEFSEGLLQTLYYETDIGSIPRGNTLDTSASKPKYFDSNNWDCLIQGCYWCSDGKLDILGICCSKECLFYFHDWCVERIDFFTKRRFCRFPGCDKLTSHKKTLYCDDTHETEFRKVFPKWVDQPFLSKSILRNGPTWYKSEHPSNSCHKSGHSPNLSQQNSSVTSPASQTQTYAKVVSSTKNQNLKKGNDQDSKKALPGTTTKSVSDGKSSSDTKNSPIIKNNPLKPPQNAKPSGKKKKDECPYMDFPPEFKNLLIFETDIGVIPREKPTPIQLTSLYSSCPNWKRDTNGCYFCGYNSKTDIGNDYFNTFRCYLIFYEWCRRKIKFFTGTALCRLPGCVRTASVGYDCCNKEHTLALQEIYGNVKKIDFKKMMEQGPNWYKEKDCAKILSKQSSIKNKNSQSDATNQNSKIDKLTQPNPDPNPQGINRAEATPSQLETSLKTPPHPPNIVFAWELTQFLYYCTDIGPIPREIFPLMPPSPNLISPNWSAEIPQCYWCCAHPKQNDALTCSNQCSFLLNEWIHSKYTKVSNKRLCRYLGCDLDSARNSECCNRDHSSHYNFYRQFYPMLKSTEFALGPKWYHDTDTTQIDFYERDEPFFELTNFYQCRQLFISNILWPTSEHAFQANKFVGTPLMIHVSRLNTPREAFKFARLPKFQSWIRPDWHSVKVSVMLNILRYKFLQNPHLADLLNRTGDRFICEHTSNDRFWGDGGDRTGANKLGELLMRVRSELRVSNPYFPTQLNHFPIVPTSVPLPIPINTQFQLISGPVPIPIQQPVAVNAGANHLFAPRVHKPPENPTPTIPFSTNSSSNTEISGNGTMLNVNNNYPYVFANSSSFKMELKWSVDLNEPNVEKTNANSSNSLGTDSKGHRSQTSDGAGLEYIPGHSSETFTSLTLPSTNTLGRTADTYSSTGTFAKKNSEARNNSSEIPDLINLNSNVPLSPGGPQPCQEEEKVKSLSYLITNNQQSNALSNEADSKFAVHQPDLITLSPRNDLVSMYEKSSLPDLIDLSPVYPSTLSANEGRGSDLIYLTESSTDMSHLPGDRHELNLDTFSTMATTNDPLNINVPPKDFVNTNNKEASSIFVEDNLIPKSSDSTDLFDFHPQDNPALQCLNNFRTDQALNAPEITPAANNCTVKTPIDHTKVALPYSSDSD